MSKFQIGNQVGRLWQKGVSGNPKGRTPIIPEVREYAKGYTREAIQGLVRVLRDKKTPPASRVAAANALLDRGWGRPAQQIEHSGTLGSLGAILDSAFARLDADEDGQPDSETQH
jgi:hypothetical protein